MGRNTVSARYDIFGIDSNAENNLGAEEGHAWTVAYIFNQACTWRFALEWLHRHERLGAASWFSMNPHMPAKKSNAVFDPLYDRPLELALFGCVSGSRAIRAHPSYVPLPPACGVVIR